jgi:diamine N-acetyltransferase
MIDQKYQDQALGIDALAMLIKYIKTMPLGNGNKLYLSYVPSNFAAEQLYKAAGFVPNGEKIEEELVLVLDLEK